VTETITRATVLDDLSARTGRVHCDTCGKDATGRVIDAYVGRFNEKALIDDEQGRYFEEIDPTAWNKRLADLQRSRTGLRGVSVFYNHGFNLYGEPSDAGSHPVGHPMAVRADAAGLLTATHYGNSDYASRVLQDLLDGNVTGHSFTGRIVRSDPQRPSRARPGQQLPLVRRLELGLVEYGPTPVPYYEGAQLVGSRSRQLDPATERQLPADAEPEVIVVSQHTITQADIARRIRLAQITGHLS
jgi:hypothetical protein